MATAFVVSNSFCFLFFAEGRKVVVGFDLDYTRRIQTHVSKSGLVNEKGNLKTISLLKTGIAWETEDIK